MSNERRPRSRISAIDLCAEATQSLFVRPGRTMLTVLGTVLGIGAIVATLGIANTAGNQVVTQFDALTATYVRIRPAEEYDRAIPWDAGDRLERLNGVVAAGTLSGVTQDPTRAALISDPMARNEHQLPVLAASEGLFDAVGARLSTGRFFDDGHSARADAIAVLGTGAAQRLSIDRVDHQPAIFVGDELLIVAGIVDDTARAHELLDAVLIPNGTARERFDMSVLDEVHVRTELGAAGLIALQAPTALDPNDPQRLAVTAPPDPAVIRRSVEEDVNALFLILGGVSLLIGAIGIANVTLVSVLERVGEVGLRRALGAARRHIAAQFLLESAAMGFLGGVVGASGGVLVVVGVAAAREWTPVMDAWIPLAAPVLGLVVGLLAGLYPALKAANLEPVDALRSGV